jgi:hypothetical protein
MRRTLLGGWTFALALAFAVPLTVGAAGSAMAADTAAAPLSKEEAAKLKEHKKLRDQIAKVKYPATKAEVVAKIKGIKADDKKWFEETLPDKSYNSADEVATAVGWEVTPPAEKTAKSDKAASKGTAEKAAK